MVKGRLRVLLVEDSRKYLELMQGMLEKNGFTVIPASDGTLAAELLEKESGNIDLVVTDLLMPGMDGSELAEINSHKYHLPLVVVTGIGDAKTALELLRCGVQDFLVKPFEESTFIGVVKNAITRNVLRISSLERSPRYEGNVASITFRAIGVELKKASNWLESRVSEKLGKEETSNFLSYVYEFIQNAYEHGSLGISEDMKSAFLDAGNYNEELANREIGCQANISLSVSVLEKEIAIQIRDEGKGFDFGKYLNMTQSDVLERITKPNGRGIFMARGYFDSIQYGDNGSSVTLHKHYKA